MKTVLVLIFSLTYTCFSAPEFKKRFGLDTIGIVTLTVTRSEEIRNKPKSGGRLKNVPDLVFVAGKYVTKTYEIVDGDQNVLWRKEVVNHSKFIDFSIKVHDLHFCKGKLFVLYSIGKGLVLDIVHRSKSNKWKISQSENIVPLLSYDIVSNYMLFVIADRVWVEVTLNKGRPLLISKQVKKI